MLYWHLFEWGICCLSGMMIVACSLFFITDEGKLKPIFISYMNRVDKDWSEFRVTK